MNRRDTVVEERIGTMIVEGQRHEILLRSTPDAQGTWHNVIVFQRDGIHSPPGALTTGLDWHLPPDLALARSLLLADAERIELYQRALQPRPPIA